MPSKYLQYIVARNIDGKELTDEKIRDFKRVVLAQVAIIFSLFLLAVFETMDFAWRIEIAESVFFATLGVYCFLLWDMLRNYASSRRVIIVNFIFIMGVFLFGVVGVNPFYPMAPTPSYRIFLAIVQICLMAVEISVIYYTILEFFKKDLGLPIKLWGAACIYLMIGLAFGSVYEILCISQLDCLGVDIPLRTIALMKRIGFSFMVLSGMGFPYSNVSELMYAAGTVEALWGQIFIVLIVGRLLVK
jgi:hypothetical protein